ncbi:MAG: ribosomal-processing cysteine protease Prp [Clostridia bacterium]|nr:ribosomal-processing cysteine protease Prp [Clostridia bacterium]
MTKIIFFRSGGSFYGFEEQGHACSNEDGNDVLCAAISAMTMLIINTVEVAYASDVDYEIDDDNTRIKVTSKAALPEYEEDERKRYAVSGLFMSYFYQLNDMVEDYYENLEVDVVDKDYAE